MALRKLVLLVGLILSLGAVTSLAVAAQAPTVTAQAPTVTVQAPTVAAQVVTREELRDLTKTVDGLLANFAEATSGERQTAVRIVVGVAIAFVLVSTLLLLHLGSHVRQVFWQNASNLGPDAWRTYLLQLPLGAPDGSVRALVSIFVIVFGMIVLVLQKPLGLANVEAISGFIGIVITFYFTARSNDQVQKATDAARDAANNANAAVANANSVVAKTAEDTKAQMASAATTLTDAARTVATTPTAAPAATATSTAGDGQGKLLELRDRLADIRGVAQVAGTLGVGTEIMAGADKVLETADRLLSVVSPLLSGRADAGAIASVIDSVSKELGPVENLGLPGTLADSIAAIRGIADVAGPIIAGIPGGPIGIVGGIVMAGVQLARNRQQFEAFKTAILNKPFDPDLMPAIVVDGNAAKAALDSAPQIKKLLGTNGDAAATDLMRTVLRRGTDGQLPMPVADVANAILANGLEAGGTTVRLDGSCTVAQLSEALAEYRGTLLFHAASNQVQGQVALPAVGSEPGRSIDIPKLLIAARGLTLRAPQAGAEIEKLMFLAEALGKVTDRGGDGIAGLIGPALGLAVNLLPQRAERREEQ
jgi:hypothetical protein